MEFRVDVANRIWKVSTFDALGEGEVYHKTHIGLVNAHTIGYGGTHHRHSATQPGPLDPLSIAFGLACVVEICADAGSAEAVRGLMKSVWKNSGDGGE